ncbi:preprotein translocase subunit SecA [Buchnera aphidicola (Taiwanaphis decaspermi)]|uniref:preprotein translocase subunit SecA n=1 Tax=Buchnera aphidicola TaxID=9 RepID=UPI0031B81E96
MVIKFLKKIFINNNDKLLNKMMKTVNVINSMESNFEKLSNNQLKLKTYDFKKRIKNGENLDDLLPEAFATVREASKRIFNMRHFDVQLLGGIVLNNKCIAEMRTGEGKTLTSTLPAYLNSLTNKGVHIVTMNNYLAKRDAKKNKLLFNFLNLTVGVNLPNMSAQEKRKSYLADITYGTNNEYGFDYLRDNMVSSFKDKVQRKLNYALIDEVDSILIDEARTPLIISGESENNKNLYTKIKKIIPYLILQHEKENNIYNSGHFYLDRKNKQVYLTEKGLIAIEKILILKNILKKKETLYSNKNISIMHQIISLIKAYYLFHKNVDYIIENNNIVIVDEHTGRIMPGRRWSDGLHQAIESKENLFIKDEHQTHASITFQNYFRLYPKLSGMTGTAHTESFEFSYIYDLETIIIPTNAKMIRKDFSDLVYITEKEKIYAIVQDIKKCYLRSQPVLVGTISIEKSEMISHLLKKIGIPHNVLNAKLHAKEAKIIAQAGKQKSITIATNMAGRGTDIMLGGNIESKINKNNISKIKKIWEQENKKVLFSGGLHVIGTERHESRRIDNQLRGRSGRQGDVGSSRFYLSMEDNLMKIFSSSKTVDLLRKLGVKYGEPIEHPWVNKAISNAQKKVETRNFEIRKQLLEYDDIINEQRKIIYKQRDNLLISKNISKNIIKMRKEVISYIFYKYDIFDVRKIKENIKNNIKKILLKKFNMQKKYIKYIVKKFSTSSNEKIINNIVNQLKKNYEKRTFLIKKNKKILLEKKIMLQILDKLWQDHINEMDYLRQGIHFRGYAQKDPKQEYKIDSFNIFSNMLNNLKYEIIVCLSKINVIK